MGQVADRKRVAAAAKVDGVAANRAPVAPGGREAEALMPIGRIDAAGRLRVVDAAAVEALVVSIRETGLSQRIIVRPSGQDAEGDRFKLLVGAHRLEAIKRLGWTHVPILIRHGLSDAQALLIEIDENLIRRELTPFERAVFIEARLKAWAEVHPDRVTGGAGDDADLAPKRGRPKNLDKMSTFLGDVPPAMGFRTETANDLGVSEKTVRRALEVARGLSKPARDKLAASAIGRNEGLLRQIASVADPKEQLAIVEALDGQKVKTFAEAQALANGRAIAAAPPRAVDQTIKELEKLWKSAPKTHRAAILEYLSHQELPAPWSLLKGRADV